VALGMVIWRPFWTIGRFFLRILPTSTSTLRRGQLAQGLHKTRIEFHGRTGNRRSAARPTVTPIGPVRTHRRYFSCIELFRSWPIAIDRTGLRRAGEHSIDFAGLGGQSIARCDAIASGSEPIARAADPRPPIQVAERSEAAQAAPAAPLLSAAQGNEHPFDARPALGLLGHRNIEKLQDYSATLAKRERIGGKLMDYEYMALKLRHKPFSVYIVLRRPSRRQGTRGDLYPRPERRQHVGARRGHAKTPCSARSS